ncbi:AIG2-like protein D [Sesamum alatum]|uniref:AIG2-like protein D n=1 Tax=Sesamum alatum TaxID=300844 RepID=A0AAE1XSS7_9LAMI|nr:AIG2-like protein D [Sesamum alatum]
MGSAFAANPAAISNVFVYGSLLADDVVRALLTHVPPSCRAILLKTGKFLGRYVLVGITPPELHILDEFEDNKYERKTVEWDFEDWKVLHMDSFLKMTKGLRKG